MSGNFFGIIGNLPYPKFVRNDRSRPTFHTKLIYWLICRIQISPISVTTFDNCFVYNLEIGNLCEFSCLFGAPLLSLLKLCCFYYTFKDCNWSKASWSNLFELHPQKKSCLRQKSLYKQTWFIVLLLKTAYNFLSFEKEIYHVSHDCCTVQ